MFLKQKKNLYYFTYNKMYNFQKKLKKGIAIFRAVWYNEFCDYTETYRSGHNGTDSKSVVPYGTVGSNPTVSAKRSRLLESSRLLLEFAVNCV